MENTLIDNHTLSARQDAAVLLNHVPVAGKEALLDLQVVEIGPFPRNRIDTANGARCRPL